ncbi:hypothetical protein IAQ61_003858 [Plenodomus lingam]|uniref:F-box domain-containing protein n=1 Tax=Leptosphaeria maculans (strain JN3 / isolate v23.1.3 / race Av1-4-5-6-7-8) TaxID=985895 RepID=E4ZQH9_LEPMJ|nr:hypothetical protein LEMA_P036580.1 [Plenodomus lingam JN3]KAH9874668.1 hypothetical protein IAQ61_003858 [Plenodomus lingam]CBX93984.1 hypothetical protein LEMA_P036580.1 [Plenodomus lingam JN3]
MFSNLQIRPARSHRRKPSLTHRAGVSKRRVSTVSAATVNNVPSLSLMKDLFGDEFPEAFATSSGLGRASRKTILDLPAALLSLTCDHLSKLDIKRLRLTSQYLAKNVDLRIDRVYISPNRANLACLEWILKHPRHSNSVREIVWDDAQLEEYPTLESFRRAIDADDLQWTRKLEDRLEASTRDRTDGDYYPLERDDFFHQDGRLSDPAKNILLRYDDRFSRAVLARNAMMMSVEDSYALYSRLYHEEQDLMKQGVDVAALEQALRSFPYLKRVTLTSEVWRPWHFVPRYDTPFSRSLPIGFRKPTVWPWCGRRPSQPGAELESRTGMLTVPINGSLPGDWRGYTIVTSALLSQGNGVEEFLIDSGSEPAGISHQIFRHPNQELDRTIQLFRTAPLRRLQIVLYDKVEFDDTGLMHNYLNRALSELSHLTHLDLKNSGGNMSCLFPDKILPPTLLAQLKIFALRGYMVAHPSLLSSLQQMVNAQQITFEDILLSYNQPTAPSQHERLSNTQELFQELRVYYTQQEYNTTIGRPVYTWIQQCGYTQYFFHRCRMVQEELNDYLYSGWDCPFHMHEIKENVGWVVDGRDPEYKRRAAEVMHLQKSEDDTMGSDDWLPEFHSS